MYHPLKVGHWVVYSTSSEYWNFCIIVPYTSQVFPFLFSSRRVWSRIYWFPIWTVPIVLVGTWTIEYLTMICASQKSATMAPWKRRNIATLESNANLDQLQKISNMAERISPLIKKKLQHIEFQIWKNHYQLLILVSSQKKKMKNKICMTTNLNETIFLFFHGND